MRSDRRPGLRSAWYGFPGSHLSAAVLLLAAVLALSGCFHAGEESSIPPLPAAAGRVDPGLGPGARPLSSGPGYKGSPSWSPTGDRIAFTVDGNVVDKPAYVGEPRRWTTRDFVAQDAEWTSGDGLTMLGAVAGAATPSTAEGPRSVYRTTTNGGSFDLKKVASGVLAMSPGPPGKGGLVLAVGDGSYESRIVHTREGGEVDRVYGGVVRGAVTAISPSPDGRGLVLAVRPPGHSHASGLGVFDLRGGGYRERTRLDGGLEILGTPQWTHHGIYFVAGEEEPSGGAAPLYDLYRAPPEPGRPEPAPGVGEDFVAASVRASPDGGRLAVIGRLNPKSPANVYVFDLPTEELRAVTANEDMEIKTGPDDLAWSPGGESVTIVARGLPSPEPEVHPAAAENLLNAFYNLYEVPVEGPPAEAPG